MLGVNETGTRQQNRRQKKTQDKTRQDKTTQDIPPPYRRAVLRPVREKKEGCLCVVLSRVEFFLCLMPISFGCTRQHNDKHKTKQRQHTTNPKFPMFVREKEVLFGRVSRSNKTCCKIRMTKTIGLPRVSVSVRV
jgi:hypothetical protein